MLKSGSRECAAPRLLVLYGSMLFHSDSPSSGTVVARSTTHKRREARFLLGIPAKHLQATSVV